MDFDISLYELIVGNGDLTLENINENKTVIGRVLGIIKNTDTNNFVLDYSLLSENNFKNNNPKIFHCRYLFSMFFYSYKYSLVRYVFNF